MATPKPHDPTPDLSHIAADLRPLAQPIADLTPDPANARKRTAKNLTAIASSLKRFGQRRPIVVQREGMVVRAGNGIMEAALSIGWTHLACVVVDDNGTDAVQFAIADNRTAELLEWDKPVLADLLDTFDAAERLDLGFSEQDFDELLAGLQPSFTPDNTPEIGTEQVDAAGLEEAQRSLEAGIAGEEVAKLDVVCPKCAHVFQVQAPTS